MKTHPPERLLLRYATAEVVTIGRGLHRVIQSLQRGDLENIRPLDRRYAGLSHTGPIISSIVVTRKEMYESRT